MSLFPFSNMKDVWALYSLGFESLWGSVFLAVAAETQMSAGYVAKAIWLAVHSEPEKVPLFKRGMEENLDVSTLSLVKCAAHIKKKVLFKFFCILAPKTYLRYLIGLNWVSG